MPEQDNESTNVKQIRQALERAQAREAAWKNVALDGLVQGAGFNPKDPIVGLLVSQFNNDDLDPTELDAQAFAKFAKQYNVEPPKAETANTPDPNLQQQVDQMQQQQAPPQQQVPAQQTPAPQQPVPAQGFMQQFQAPADQLLNSSAANPPAQPTTLEQQVAQAEQAGNYDASFAGKFNLTRQAFNASPQPAQHTGQVNQQGLPVHSPGT